MSEKHGAAKAGEQMRSVLDASCIRDELEWIPTVSLDDGISQTVDYFRSKYVK